MTGSGTSPAIDRHHPGAARFHQTCAANRGFMQRAVRHLARQGITQFLDLGAGPPVSPAVHEVAQAVNPAARVVYVDHDPLVAERWRLLQAGNTGVIEADLRDPKAIMEHKELRRLLDLDRPIAILLLFALNHIADRDDPAGIVAGLMGAAAPGSHLVLSHPADDIDYGTCADQAIGFCRGFLEVFGFFSGLRLLAPGLIRASLWRPDDVDVPCLGSVWAYGGVARK